MSKARGRQHRGGRVRGGRTHDDKEYGIVPALARSLAPEDLNEAKASARSALIRMMGSQRGGPVKFKLVPPSKARAALEGVDDTGRYLEGGYDEFLEKHPGSWLVLAVAPARPTRPPS